jgi:hypothetical protein
MATQKEVSFEEISRELDKGIAGADTFRADRLDGLTAVRAVKDQRLWREQTRLAQKLGPTHPHVTEIMGRLTVNAAMMRDLKLESARARTETPQVDQNTWVLHGYVRDKDLKGVSNLTVALYDQSGGRLNGVNHGCTDSNGYFRMAGKSANSASAAYIRVLSKDGAFLYADRDPFSPTLGAIDYREIILSGEEATCIPPPDPIDPPTVLPPTISPPPPPTETRTENLPPRDYWVVRGRVADKLGKGLGGLFVSVYDKDLFFDDRLGQSETDANGNYTLTYRTEDFRDLIERKPDLYLKVIDRQGRSLYVLKGHIWYESGRVETIDIEIDR